MTKKVAPSTSTHIAKVTSVGPGYGKTRLALIVTKLERTGRSSSYVSSEELVLALRANPGVPLPPVVHEYLCDFLEGKIRAPAGRPHDSKYPAQLLKKYLIPEIYARYHTWLKRRKRSVGLEGWALIRNAHWWKGPPSERAARMTCRRLRLNFDWRRVHNILSEHK